MQTSKNILSNSTAGTSTLAEERSFDAWGRLRNPTNWSYTLGATGVSTGKLSLTNRGYTGHEHLPAYNIINMNGRVYDPVIARFMSPDPIIKEPSETQHFNRYSYSLNNPLKYFDPSGDTVSVIISGPTMSKENSSSYTNGLAGHVALNIDGKTHSYEGSGKWITYNKTSSYLKTEQKDRWTVEITLDVNQKEIEKKIDINNKEQIVRLNDNDKGNDNQYNVETNSCVTNTMELLNAGGIKFNKTNGAVTLEQLGEALMNSNYNTNVNENKPNFDKSFAGRLLYNITKVLGIQDKVSGSQINTKELIKIEHN